MAHILIFLVGFIAIVAIVLWFVSKVAIPAPLIYVVYAGLAIFCILVILWLMNGLDSGAFHFSSLLTEMRMLA